MDSIETNGTTNGIWDLRSPLFPPPLSLSRVKNYPFPSAFSAAPGSRAVSEFHFRSAAHTVPPPAVWATTSGLRLPVLSFAHNFRSAAPFPLRAAWHSGSCSPLPPQDARRDAAIGSSDFQLVSVTQLPVRGSQPRLRSPLPVWNNNFRSVVVGFGYGLQFGSASPTSCFRLPRCSRSEPRGTLGAAVHFRSALHSGTRDRKF